MKPWHDWDLKIPRWVVLLIALTTWPAAVFSAPIFTADAENVKITLTDEPCTVKTVSNLPFRATWEEKGKLFEGCWAPRLNEGVVIGYFSDLTVVAIPIPVFKRVVGI